MRQFLFIFISLIFCGYISGQGVTKHGQNAVFGTYFVNTSGKIQNVQSLSKHGKNLLSIDIATTIVASITTTTAVSGGNIISDGGNSITARGVCWSTTSNPDLTKSKTVNGTGTGTYTSSLTGLTPSTVYHVRAYATNNSGTSYGADVMFTTLSVIPTVTTTVVTAITATTAVAGGNVTADGGVPVTSKGICYGTSPAPTLGGTHTNEGSGNGEFTSNLTGLSSGSVYYVRAYATNSVGTSYGAEVVFKTVPNYTWTAKPYFTLPPTSDSCGITIVSEETSTLYGNTLANFPLESEALWSIVYTCDIGSQSGDDFIVTPTDSDLGLHTFKIDLLCDGVIYATQVTHLNIIDKVNRGDKKLLCFGNSLMATNFDHEMGALNSIFDGVTFTTIGIYALGSYFHNAISGFSYIRFLNNSKSPLVKNGVFNVPAFFADNALTTPDYVYVRLGVNDINAFTADGMSEEQLNSVLSNMETFVDAFLGYDPNLKVIIGLPTYCSSNKALWDADYDGTPYEDKHDVFIENMHRFYFEIINNYRTPQYNTRVQIDYAALFVNRLNYRDAIHTNDAGSWQLGLGFANTIAKLLTE